LSRTLFSLSTTSHPSISRPPLVAREHTTERLVFSPRCFSLAFCLWPWRTASVVPIIAGQAAIAVKMPSTIVVDTNECEETLKVVVPGSRHINLLLARRPDRDLESGCRSRWGHSTAPHHWSQGNHNEQPKQVVLESTGGVTGFHAVIVPRIWGRSLKHKRGSI
jgi:hypothetical protein